MRDYHVQRIAIWLRNCGWKVRQVDRRQIWYKGRAGAEIVARHMADAERLEYTLQRAHVSSFMWGLDVAMLLNSGPPVPEPKPPSTQKRNKAAAALEALDGFTGTTQMDQAIFATASAPARAILAKLAAPGD